MQIIVKPTPMNRAIAPKMRAKTYQGSTFLGEVMEASPPCTVSIYPGDFEAAIENHSISGLFEVEMKQIAVCVLEVTVGHVVICCF